MTPISSCACSHRTKFCCGYSLIPQGSAFALRTGLQAWILLPLRGALCPTHNRGPVGATAPRMGRLVIVRLV